LHWLLESLNQLLEHMLMVDWRLLRGNLFDVWHGRVAHGVRGAFSPSLGVDKLDLLTDLLEKGLWVIPVLDLVLLLHFDQLTLKRLSLDVHLVKTLVAANHLVLVLNDGLDAETADKPVILEPFL
jgi:hypothetical protein